MLTARATGIAADIGEVWLAESDHCGGYQYAHADRGQGRGLRRLPYPEEQAQMQAALRCAMCTRPAPATISGNAYPIWWRM